MSIHLKIAGRLESRLVMLDAVRFTLIVVPPNRNDIEAGVDSQKLFSLQIPQCRASYPALFFLVDSFCGVARFRRRVCLDFHEDDRLAALIDGNQIDLARFVRFALSNNDKPFLSKQPRSGLLATPPDRPVRINDTVSPIDVTTMDSIKNAAHDFSADAEEKKTTKP
jgi:hypothetical protein